MNAVALIDCNSFYVSCERLFQPQLNDKPVIVLSNNDGCIVSRSQEVKALGIPVGIPLFQVRDQVLAHDIQVYSSNYTLYGDISSRVHEAIRHFSDKIENYSIDEAFVELEENGYLPSFFNAGVEIRTKIKRWTGIPTSVGIGPTKTLAKIAGNVAKESPEGVFDIMISSMTLFVATFWSLSRERVLLERFGIENSLFTHWQLMSSRIYEELRVLFHRTEFERSSLKLTANS